MKTSKWVFICSIVLALLCASCSSPTPSATSSTPTSAPKLDDSLLHGISIATQSSNFQAPQDSTPDADGTTIYFTADGPHGAGVFKVPASGGAATEVFVGSPFVSPRGIIMSPDGKTLFITDPKADQIFTLAITGNSPLPLQGSKGTTPQNLSLVGQNQQQVLYFTGKDPASGQAAVLKLSAQGADTATVVVEGSPLVTPDGVVVTQTGIIYVADRSTTDTGQVFKIDSGTLTPLLKQVRLGNPAGIALSPDESILLVSALQDNSYDQVLLVDLATGQTGSVTKVVGQNLSDAGGLHASPVKKNIFSWNGVRRGGNGAVYLVEL